MGPTKSFTFSKVFPKGCHVFPINLIFLAIFHIFQDLNMCFSSFEVGWCAVVQTTSTWRIIPVSK